MEQMQEFLQECLKSVDLKTVTKADLKKKYLKEKGLTKLSKEDKKLFSSLVETVYINFMNSDLPDIASVSNDKKIYVPNSKNESAAETILSNDSDLTESEIKFQENKSDIKLSTDPSSNLYIETAQKENDLKSTNEEDNYSNNILSNIDANKVLVYSKDNIYINEKDNSSDEEPLVKYQKKESKENLEQNLPNNNKNESLESAKMKKNKTTKPFSEESDDDAPLISVKKNLKKRSFSLVDSSDSEDGTERPTKKNSSKLIIPATQKSNPRSSVKVKKTKKKLLHDSKNNSEVEDFQSSPKFQKNKSRKISKHMLLQNSKKTSQSNSDITNSSDSDEVPLISFKIKEQSKNSLKNNSGDDTKALNSVQNNSTCSKKISSSESDDEPLKSLKSSNKNHKKLDPLAVSSDSDVPLESLRSNKQNSVAKTSADDSDDEPLIALKKTSNNTFKLKKSVKFAEKSPVSSNKSKTQNKSRASKIISKESDDDPLISLNSSKRISKSIDICLNSVEPDVPLESLKNNKEQTQSSISNVSFDESEEEPLESLKNNKKQTQNSISNVIFEESEEEPLVSIKSRLKKKSLEVSFEDSDDEPLVSYKSNGKNEEGSKVSTNSGDTEPSESVVLNDKQKSEICYESDDEPLVSLKNKKQRLSIADEDVNNDSEDDFLNTKKTNKSRSLSLLETSDSDEEPLVSKKLSKVSESKIKLINKKMSSHKEKSNQNRKGKKRKISKCVTVDQSESDSEEEPLAKFAEKKSKKEATTPKTSSKQKNYDEEIPIVNKMKKVQQNDVKQAERSVVFSSDSDDEPLVAYSKQKSDSNDAKKVETSEIKNSADSSVSSFSENEENPVVQAKIDKKNKSKTLKTKEQKKPTSSENKLEHLKKYVRAAGLRVQSYAKLFENCNSMKAKCDKLRLMLEKEGLKGRPTLAKCKKIKEKIETRKEVAELDISNIISKDSKKRSACTDTTNYQADEEVMPITKRFSRLQGIVDSEESN